jgi:hypothetical protein
MFSATVPGYATSPYDPPDGGTDLLPARYGWWKKHW